uniref:Uncharacterized protein n=1 Tax=viral metagenome TaxID=1070528 RepID=A0A6C0KKM2_9ZZZZ
MNNNTKIFYLLSFIIIIHLCSSCKKTQEGLLAEAIQPILEAKKDKNNISGNISSFIYSDTKSANDDSEFLGLLVYSFFKLVLTIIVLPPVLILLCIGGIVYGGPLIVSAVVSFSRWFFGTPN